MKCLKSSVRKTKREGVNAKDQQSNGNIFKYFAKSFYDTFPFDCWSFAFTPSLFVFLTELLRHFIEQHGKIFD
jgi:hypothetical protein